MGAMIVDVFASQLSAPPHPNLHNSHQEDSVWWSVESSFLWEEIQVQEEINAVMNWNWSYHANSK